MNTSRYRLFISVIVFLSAWEVVARASFVHISLFPPPSHVFQAIKEMYHVGDLTRDVGASLWRAIVGFILGGVCGVIFGLLTGRNTIISDFFSPLINLFRSIPPVAIIPLVIVWFGIGDFSKVFSIGLAVFFPVWVNAHYGSREIPKTFIWTADSMGIKGFNLFIKVILPGSLPFILAGLRTAVAVAFIMVFVSEMAGASSGIGYQINVSHLAYRVDRMVASLIVLGLLGALSDFLVGRTFLKLFPWVKYTTHK